MLSKHLKDCAPVSWKMLHLWKDLYKLLPSLSVPQNIIEVTSKTSFILNKLELYS